MTILCAHHGHGHQQLVATFLLTTLAFAACVEPQLQQHATSQLNKPTPYPAAGYRPKTPFHLPRQPKVYQTLDTGTEPTATIDDNNIEKVDQTPLVNDTTVMMPPNTYGTPKSVLLESMGEQLDVDLLSGREVINAPTEYFLPPLPNLAKNFNAAEPNNTQDVPLLLADVPAIIMAMGNTQFSAQPQQTLNTLNSFAQIPAGTYGAPFNPVTETTAVFKTNSQEESTLMPELELQEPELETDLVTESELVTNSESELELESKSELEANESSSELNETDNELAGIFIPLVDSNGRKAWNIANNEALNRLSALKADRLILLSTDNTNLRQINLVKFANMPPIKRRY